MGRLIDVTPMREKLRLQSFGDLGEVADASLQLVDLAPSWTSDRPMYTMVSFMPFLGAKEVQSRIFGAVEALDNADGAPLRSFRH
jgi:hypothetical protein